MFTVRVKGGCELLCLELAEQQFITERLLSRTWESETSKGILLRLTLLTLTLLPINFFYTGCFVYLLNVLLVKCFKLRTLF